MRQTTKRRTEWLTPTVIPAQPGFRRVWFGLDADPSESTTAKELIECSEPVIAWLIRPGLIREEGVCVDRYAEPDVEAITPHFAGSDRDLIVSPEGQWSRYGHIFKDEAQAREVWLGEDIEAEQARRSRAR